MMLLSLLANPVVRPECHHPSLKPLLSTRARRNMIRCAEGISLWLAMVLMLFVHPLYAEARAMESEQPGQLYLVDRKSAWQEPALVLDSRCGCRLHPQSGRCASSWSVQSALLTKSQCH